MLARYAHILLPVSYNQLPRLERFVRRKVPDLQTAMRMTILSTELFDNIVCHARGVCPSLVWIRIQTGGTCSLRIAYHAKNFDTLVATLRGRLADKFAGRPIQAPSFDASAGRYRGFGLNMCIANARDIAARSGIFWNVLSVVL